MEKIVLECKNLKKSINKKEIIKDVSFDIKEGEIVGLIGTNGEGKTTTIKLLLGLQRKDEGEVLINDFSIDSNFEKAVKKVGAVIETPDFYNYLSGYKNLEISANYYKDIEKSRIMEVANIVGLKNRIYDNVSKYSLGMKQRLDIADALINKPNILILDEPTNRIRSRRNKRLKKIINRTIRKTKNIYFNIQP